MSICMKNSKKAEILILVSKASSSVKSITLLYILVPSNVWLKFANDYRHL